MKGTEDSFQCSWFCIRVGDIRERLYSERFSSTWKARKQTSGSVLVGNYELCVQFCSSPFLSFFDFENNLITSAKALRGGWSWKVCLHPSCSPKFDMLHSVKSKLDGIVHWEKVPYLKFTYKLNKRISLKHFTLFKAGMNGIVFPILLTVLSYLESKTKCSVRWYLPKIVILFLPS